MMAVESTEILSPLETAKVERRKAAKAEKKEAIRASTKILDSRACAGKVEAIGKACNAAVLAARPAEVLRLRDKLRVAEVDAEIATTRAATSTARHAAAVEKLQQAEAEVERCARAQIDEEILDLANKVNRAVDAAMELGKQLQALAVGNPMLTPLNAARPELPRAVTGALERAPKPNPLDVPVSILRYGEISNAFALRLAELVANEQQED